MMSFFRRRARPKPYEHVVSGCFYNTRRQRWELCAADAQMAGARVHQVEVWRCKTETQADLLDQYDRFQRMLHAAVRSGSSV